MELWVTYAVTEQNPALSHQYGLAQAILWDVTLQIRRQLHEQRTYFFPTGAFFIGYKTKMKAIRRLVQLNLKPRLVDFSNFICWVEQQTFVVLIGAGVMRRIVIHKAALDSRWLRCICRTSPHAGASCPPQIWRSDRPDSWLQRCCCPAGSRGVEARVLPLRWGTVADLRTDRHTKRKSQNDAQH